MVTPRQVHLLRASFAVVQRQSEVAGLVFYQHLFERDPSLRALFKTDIEVQSRKLMDMLAAALGLFGGMLGLPALFMVLAGLFGSLELEPLAVVCGLLAFLSFFGSLIAAWVFIFRGRSLLRRAEQSFFAGNFMAVTDDAFFERWLPRAAACFVTAFQ